MNHLFSQETATRDFVDLEVEGFSKLVPGVVFTAGNPPCCGVPLGGIGTGCIDFDPRGIFGWSSIFNPRSLFTLDHSARLPRRLPDVQPVFEFSLGGKVYNLATEEILRGGMMDWCTAPALRFGEDIPQDHVEVTPTPDTIPAKAIRYYGHYPVADVEYEFDAPVSVGVRAWASFIPGNSAESNIPAAVFEVRIRNQSDTPQSGLFAMNFVGPNQQEARGLFFTKTRIDEKAKGLRVRSDGGVEYFIGAFDESEVMTGTGLSDCKKQEYGYGGGYLAKKSGWGSLANGLPQDVRFADADGVRKVKDPSASAAVPFTIEPGCEKTVEFVLAWYAPVFESAVYREDRIVPGFEHGIAIEMDRHMDEEYGEASQLTQMYAARYGSVMDVVRQMARERRELLHRIFTWQEVLLTRESLPAWLRDSLLNILCLLTEDGYWFLPRYPLGSWAFPNGAFTYYESPRDCPHSSCIPNDWIGTMHLTYLFPDLYLQLLRSYKAVQRADGEIPFSVGRLADVPSFAQPEFAWQASLNGTCYIMMIDRLWLAKKDDAILREFYDSIKRCHGFMRGAAKRGWLCIPDKGGSEWFENSKFYGYTSHVGGLHLSQLLIVERMAKAMGDIALTDECRRDYEEGRRQLEEKLWAGTHYLTWVDDERGEENDDVMAYQLDGIFTNAQAGIHEKMYDNERVKTVLDTVWNANVRLGNGYGTLNYAGADGGYMSIEGDAYGKYCVFTQNTVVLAMTAMYCGDKERGLALVESVWRNLVLKQGLGWDMTHIVHAEDGRKVFGADYNQQSVIWSLPAAIEGTDISGPLREGGLVSDMLRMCKNLCS